MRSLSDSMLAGGCAVHAEAVHGESIEILGGADAGKKFTGIVEVESDEILASTLGEDPRARRVVRFRDMAGGVPAITSQTRLRTADGREWFAVKRPDSAYLTADFELIEHTTEDD